ncbi:ABC1 kinase family protein [Streptomyces sp. NPDC047821]|uniref:ABC1 kinase family protein n=1 Tax=Streptomyces sp. NPDC047821 TaxID=3365488 RepID=UPI00371691C9
MPPRLREELTLLHDRTSPTPFSAFEPVLRKELGVHWRKGFRSIETAEPVGSASLAQVYRAYTADGTPCVVKIQRPRAQQDMRGDMRVLRISVQVISKFFPRLTDVVNAAELVESLFRVMTRELDFLEEARNMRSARQLAEEFEYISVPEVLQATPRVLVQTFAEGVPINQVDSIDLTYEQRHTIGRELVSFMLRSYFVNRVFHADPHPGNIIISPDGTAHIIDWGMVGRIDRNTSLTFLGAFVSLARNDGFGLATHWARLGSVTPGADIESFIREVSSVVPFWSDASLEELNFGVALSSVLRYSTRHGIKITPLASVVGKSVANIEGSVRCICPDIKVSVALRKELRRIMRDLILEVFSAEQAAQLAVDALSAVNRLPAEVQAVLDDLFARNSTVRVQAGRSDSGNPVNDSSLVPQGIWSTALATAFVIKTAQRSKPRP